MADPVYKSGHQSEEDPLEFVLSDESVDRMGDVIRVDGWDLREFKKNPIALFGHSHEQIIGTWKDIRIEGKKLLGRLELAREGTSDIVNSVRSLIQQRVLKAVSVGFQPIEAQPRKGGGYDFTKSELHEVSVVSVGANANALRKAFEVTNPELAKLLLDESVPRAGDPGSGQSTHTNETPNLLAARERLKSMGIDY